MALAMAGLLLIAGGLLRVGTLMKYVPQPVITGFTAGIAVSVLLGQVKTSSACVWPSRPGTSLRDPASMGSISLASASPPPPSYAETRMTEPPLRVYIHW